MIFGRVAASTFDHRHAHAVCRELLEKQHLVRMATREPIRTVYVEHIERALRHAIAQTLECRATQARSAVPVVDELVAWQHDAPVPRGARAKRRELTVDRCLLHLTLRRHARVQRDGLGHGVAFLTDERRQSSARAATGVALST